MHEIERPIERGPLRQWFGREYFILKRKWQWLRFNGAWAQQVDVEMAGHRVFAHHSLILRPLRQVDMYLQENKRTNLRLAVACLDRTMIRQGDTFSVWRAVGRPTASKGYLEGLVLKQGRVDKGIGGGLCQLGNLLFWLFAHSPLSVIERHRHGYDVFPDVDRKVPFGAGATLSYNHIDLQVRNDTDMDFQLRLWLDDEFLHGELWSSSPMTSHYRVEERDHVMKQQFWGGYSRHNRIVRIEKDHRGTEHESLLVENHAVMMYSPFLAEGGR